MKENYKFIFDMDGTLYRFDKGQGDSFTSSRFYSDLKVHIFNFISAQKVFSLGESKSEYVRIKEKYKGEVSLGMEKEYGINRYDYFLETWGKLSPVDYLELDSELPQLLNNFEGKAAILTAAPKVWTVKVLEYLNIAGVFGGNVFTGEPDLRKPDPAIFRHVIGKLNALPAEVFSIGDQEETDILPAKSIGMKTVHIGNGITVADYQASDIKGALLVLKNEGLV